MLTRTSALGLLALVALATLAPACSSTVEEETGDADEGALTETSKPGQWVVDLAKVKREYCNGRDCTSKQFFGFDSTSIQGIPPQAGVVWDQTFAYDINKTKLDANKEFPVVKDGNKISGPKGRHVNIIPLLKNTDPSKQKHIIDWLEDGDVLSYFHPENLSAGELMERRASHVAMHYEYEIGGKKHVHHIDNPNNYGPRYNHVPTEHMPIHVFRYKPKGMSAPDSKAYGLSARNWGFITDDLSPFADFFTLTLKSTADLEKSFYKKALAGEQMAELYCSGLAYANLNLGVNFPLNQSTLGRDWAGFSGKKFARAEFRADIPARDLTAPDSLQGKKGLVFDPYTPSDMATAWLENTFQNMPVEGRKGVAMMPETQAQIAQGFSQLEFSDKRGAGGRRNNRNPGMGAEVASPENVKVWAEAYGLPASATEGFVNAADRKLATPTGAKTMKSLVDEAGIDIAGKTPMQVVRLLEVKFVSNQFVPPAIWLNEADRAESPMVYVGSIINCEMLSAADGSNKDACAGGNSGTDEFSQGAADTSTYPHYAVKNGGERTHRRFDSTPGPEKLGYGTIVTARATAADITDVLFLLHTPDMYKDQAADLRDLPMMEYDGKCTELGREGKSCAPKRGIVLDPKLLQATGTVEDKPFKFFLTGVQGVCKVKNATTMTCPIAEQTATGWRLVGDKDVSRNGRGLITTTMVDMKANDGAAGRLTRADRCTECATGGAHFNGWHIQIRNDEEPAPR